MNREYHLFTRENGYQLLDSNQDNRKTLLWIVFLFCTLFIILQRGKVQTQLHLMIIVVLLLLFFVGILYSIVQT